MGADRGRHAVERLGVVRSRCSDNQERLVGNHVVQAGSGDESQLDLSIGHGKLSDYCARIRCVLIIPPCSRFSHGEYLSRGWRDVVLSGVMTTGTSFASRAD